VISQFRTSPDVRCLLLPTHAATHGLNLCEANHVILIEPALVIGRELQAIGRIYRIGQVRPTEVHRFVCANTIEERIHVANSHVSEELSPLSRGKLERTVSARLLDEVLSLESAAFLKQRTAGGSATRASDMDYWMEKVVYNGRTMSRRDVLAILCRINRFDTDDSRVPDGTDLDSNNVLVHGLYIPVEIARELRNISM